MNNFGLMRLHWMARTPHSSRHRPMIFRLWIIIFFIGWRGMTPILVLVGNRYMKRTRLVIRILFTDTTEFDIVDTILFFSKYGAYRYNGLHARHPSGRIQEVGGVSDQLYAWRQWAELCRWIWKESSPATSSQGKVI